MDLDKITTTTTKHIFRKFIAQCILLSEQDKRFVTGGCGYWHTVKLHKKKYINNSYICMCFMTNSIELYILNKQHIVVVCYSFDDVLMRFDSCWKYNECALL